MNKATNFSGLPKSYTTISEPNKQTNNIQNVLLLEGQIKSVRLPPNATTLAASVPAYTTHHLHVLIRRDEPT